MGTRTEIRQVDGGAEQGAEISTEIEVAGSDG